MQALIAAARNEGTLNVIALPPTWANYAAIIKDFGKRYGIRVHSISPNGTSQDEINAVRHGSGASAAPDVLDVDMATALANTSLFARYQVSTWSTIPATQKDPAGRWVQDYGGYMSVGYDSARLGTINSLNQLLGPKFRNTVALTGRPTQSSAALSAVMMANLAQGGTAAGIARGVAFFHQLRQAGNFSPVQATSATIRAGQTEVVFNWDYLNTPSVVGSRSWKVFIPSNAVLGDYYAQAISKDAPHPAAARLWEEFLYSEAAGGGQNLWLAGGIHPVEQATMTANGTIDQAAAARLPLASGAPVFLTTSEAARASSFLQKNWVKAVR